MNRADHGLRTTQEPLIPMVDVVARLREAGWSVEEIAEALARTGPGGEDELAVVEEIMARRGA